MESDRWFVRIPGRRVVVRAWWISFVLDSTTPQPFPVFESVAQFAPPPAHLPLRPEFLRNGGDIFAFQPLTGHSDIDMLKTYLQPAKEDAARAHKLASPTDN
jgi:hypothetical protein